jgi:cytochrome c oxidase subunit 3
MTRELSRVTQPRSGIPSPVLGMIVFVVSELMFFMALVSTLLVIKSTTSIFAPPESVRLPIVTTGFNTLVLLTSGLFLLLSGRDFGSERSKNFFSLSIVTGAFFVAIQGYEWINLITFGLTMTSGIFGACFFLIIGIHGLHALGAIIGMIFCYRMYSRGTLLKEHLVAMQVFWGFVVLIWPLLYGLVYF